jgi:hypothetical protein
MRRVHKVPLSTPANALLGQAPDMFDSNRFVFLGATKGSPLNPRALQALLHLQVREPYAVHGRHIRPSPTSARSPRTRR